MNVCPNELLYHRIDSVHTPSKDEIHTQYYTLITQKGKTKIVKCSQKERSIVTFYTCPFLERVGPQDH